MDSGYVGRSMGVRERAEARDEVLLLAAREGDVVRIAVGDVARLGVLFELVQPELGAEVALSVPGKM
jgi:hypothetical protein